MKNAVVALNIQKFNLITFFTIFSFSLRDFAVLHLIFLPYTRKYYALSAVTHTITNELRNKLLSVKLIPSERFSIKSRYVTLLEQLMKISKTRML